MKSVLYIQQDFSQVFT